MQANSLGKGDFMLEFEVNGQRLRLKGNLYVVAESIDYLKARFAFSADWDGAAKTAIFKTADRKGVYNVILDENGICTVPSEVIHAPRFYVSVFGGSRITANEVEVQCNVSGYAEGSAPDTPTPEVYEQILAEINKKVSKVDGMGLSENSYTTEEKTKLSGIAEGAEVNVQSDWSQTNADADDYIKNKPTKLSQFENDSGYATSADLSGSSSGLSQGITNVSNALSNHQSATVLPHADGSVTTVKLAAGAVTKEKIAKGVIPTSLPASDVYNWAKQPEKPTYTAAEVGALPYDTEIPSYSVATQSKDGLMSSADKKKLDGLSEGGGGGITEETDPTVPSWAKQPEKPTYTAAEVGADSTGSAASALSDAKTYIDGKVKTNVPENAVFTDTVYDDTKIKAALNGKLDKSGGTILGDGFGFLELKRNTEWQTCMKFSNTKGDLGYIGIQNVDGNVIHTFGADTSKQYPMLDSNNYKSIIGSTYSPTSHASTATTYGLGTSSNYGHVKLSDSVSTTSGTDSGIAATPSAVKAAYDKANIVKNTSSTTGDIITTHLTVGSRPSSSTIGSQTFTSGISNSATAQGAVALGYSNTVSGKYSAAIGYTNTISSNNQHSILLGYNNKADGTMGFAAGCSNTVNNQGYAIGIGNTALTYQNKIGRYSSQGTAGTMSGTTGDALTVGIGTSSAAKNGFRVDYSGNGYFYKAVSGTGADYAEMWEWQDGNPNSADRVGYFVAFDGDKIRFANENDDLRKVGIISGKPAVIGDNFADDWQGMYLQDIYGRNITEHKSYEAEYDSEGNLIHEAYEADEYVLNPNYDATQPYIPREERKEWDAVGTHGKLVVKDDGTCQVDGYCRPTDGGIATASEDGFYVMERINDTHIRVYLR